MVEKRMREEVFHEIYAGFPGEGPGRDVYTQRAYEILPEMHEPDILDVGCGPGGPTIKLASLSGGRVTGLDLQMSYIEELERRIEAEGLSDRMRAVQGSMLEMDFSDGSFDIIWAEGSIDVIGFERGLREWKRLLRPGGALVVHEMCWLQPDPPEEIGEYWMRIYPGISTIEDKLSVISACGYETIGHFPLPENVWWEEYYGPLEERLDLLRKKYCDDRGALDVIESEQQGVDLYRRYSAWYGSVFYIMLAAG